MGPDEDGTMSEPTEQICADCGIPLSPDETFVCSDCCAFYTIFRDPNGYMAGDDDEEA
ncbi:NinF family protein [Mixta hanseatica]|uniref:NinF family protein n=1 Tax=Mixta hanseatica TaxID=2872648 RepID=A0ABY4RA36_9GAMM|nr:NinF family protein [Mixta hanseatica]